MVAQRKFELIEPARGEDNKLFASDVTDFLVRSLDRLQRGEDGLTVQKLFQTPTYFDQSEQLQDQLVEVPPPPLPSPHYTRTTSRLWTPNPYSTYLTGDSILFDLFNHLGFSTINGSCRLSIQL